MRCSSMTRTAHRPATAGHSGGDSELFIVVVACADLQPQVTLVGGDSELFLGVVSDTDLQPQVYCTDLPMQVVVAGGDSELFLGVVADTDLQPQVGLHRAANAGGFGWWRLRAPHWALYSQGLSWILAARIGLHVGASRSSS